MKTIMILPMLALVASCHAQHVSTDLLKNLSGQSNVVVAVSFGGLATTQDISTLSNSVSNTMTVAQGAQQAADTAMATAQGAVTLANEAKAVAVTNVTLGGVTQPKGNGTVALPAYPDISGLQPHLSDKANPHGVTASQIGAAPQAQVDALPTKAWVNQSQGHSPQEWFAWADNGDGTCTVTGLTALVPNPADIAVPLFLDGLRVTAIGNGTNPITTKTVKSMDLNGIKKVNQDAIFGLSFAKGAWLRMPNVDDIGFSGIVNVAAEVNIFAPNPLAGMPVPITGNAKVYLGDNSAKAAFLGANMFCPRGTWEGTMYGGTEPQPYDPEPWQLPYLGTAGLQKQIDGIAATAQGAVTGVVIDGEAQPKTGGIVTLPTYPDISALLKGGWVAGSYEGLVTGFPADPLPNGIPAIVLKDEMYGSRATWYQTPPPVPPGKYGIPEVEWLFQGFLDTDPGLLADLQSKADSLPTKAWVNGAMGYSPQEWFSFTDNKDGTAAVTGMTAAAGTGATDIYIPSYIDGLKVTRIEFSGSSTNKFYPGAIGNLRGDEVTYISQNAFYGCVFGANALPSSIIFPKAATAHMAFSSIHVSMYDLGIYLLGAVSIDSLVSNSATFMPGAITVFLGNARPTIMGASGVQIRYPRGAWSNTAAFGAIVPQPYDPEPWMAPFIGTAALQRQIDAHLQEGGGGVKSVDGKSPDTQGDVALGAMSAGFVALAPAASGGTFSLEGGKRYTVTFPYVVSGSGVIYDIVFPSSSPEIIDIFIETPAGVNFPYAIRFSIAGTTSSASPKPTINVNPSDGSWPYLYTYFRGNGPGRLTRRLIQGAPGTTFTAYTMESVLLPAY